MVLDFVCFLISVFVDPGLKLIPVEMRRQARFNRWLREEVVRTTSFIWAGRDPLLIQTCFGPLVLLYFLFHTACRRLRVKNAFGEYASDRCTNACLPTIAPRVRTLWRCASRSLDSLSSFLRFLQHYICYLLFNLYVDNVQKIFSNSSLSIEVCASSLLMQLAEPYFL